LKHLKDIAEAAKHRRITDSTTEIRGVDVERGVVQFKDGTNKLARELFETVAAYWQEEFGEQT